MSIFSDIHKRLQENKPIVVVHDPEEEEAHCICPYCGEKTPPFITIYGSEGNISCHKCKKTFELLECVDRSFLSYKKD